MTPKAIRSPTTLFAIAALLACAMVARAAVAETPPSPDAPVGEITDPQWAATPSATLRSEAYPRAAEESMRVGAAVVRCTAGKDGALGDCKAICEDPAGWGFGEGAAKIARGYRLRPSLPDGRSVAGGVVTLPIHFNPPGTAYPARCDRPSPEASVTTQPAVAEKMLVAQPKWVALPKADDMDHDFPFKAALEGLGGRASLHCVADAEGRLAGCRVTSETPAGYGFGDSALKLAASMRMEAGEAGRGVDLPVRFTDPPQFREPRFKPHDRMYGWLGPVGPYYPDRASRMNVGGVAVLECVADVSGALRPCRPILEDPPAAGFADAAMRMAAKGYLTVDPRPAPPPAGEDDVVRVKVLFHMTRRWPG
jgi:hypothetical protein